MRIEIYVGSSNRVSASKLFELGAKDSKQTFLHKTNFYASLCLQNIGIFVRVQRFSSALISACLSNISARRIRTRVGYCAVIIRLWYEYLINLMITRIADFIHHNSFWDNFQIVCHEFIRTLDLFKIWENAFDTDIEAFLFLLWNHIPYFSSLSGPSDNQTFSSSSQDINELYWKWIIPVCIPRSSFSFHLFTMDLWIIFILLSLSSMHETHSQNFFYPISKFLQILVIRIKYLISGHIRKSVFDGNIGFLHSIVCFISTRINISTQICLTW